MKIRRRLTRQIRTVFRKTPFPIKDLNQAENILPARVLRLVQTAIAESTQRGTRKEMEHWPLNNGDSNTAVGAAALLLNTTGTENSAIGTAVLVHNSTGGQNTATGAFALFTNTTGGGTRLSALKHS
jgi:hypothetical protein